MEQDVRWKQRFRNFDRAYVLLRQALEAGPQALNPLEQEGVIQRFECSYELAWKVMKDYLQEGGLEMVPLTPRQVIKSAFAAGLLKDGDTWMAMLEHRNLLSHSYDPVVFRAAVEAIAARYLAALGDLHEWFQEKALA